MDQRQFNDQLREIRHLLSQLHGDVNDLKTEIKELLLVLHQQKLFDESDVFMEKFDHLVASCRKLDENCGVLLIDVDHFESISKEYGDQTGDEVLERVSQLLKQFETPRCISGQSGDERFAVAIQGTDAEILGTAEMIRRHAERLHGPLKGPNGKFDRVEWKCTLSVGMASTHNVGFDALRLLVASKEALEKAKKKGRNRVIAAS